MSNFLRFVALFAKTTTQVGYIRLGQYLLVILGKPTPDAHP